jgi:hypothetical protein
MLSLLEPSNPSLGPHSVLLTDVKSATVELLQRNISLNDCASIASAELFDWTRKPVAVSQVKGVPYDFVIASEVWQYSSDCRNASELFQVLYDPEASALLPSVLDQLLSLETGSRVLILSMNETYRRGFGPFMCAAAKEETKFEITVSPIDAALCSDFSEYAIDWVVVSFTRKLNS